jgi:hypothetical protein
VGSFSGSGNGYRRHCKSLSVWSAEHEY